MNIIAVDDEKLALESLTDAISEAVPQAKIHSFNKVEKALEYIKTTNVDVAFLDVMMKGMNGLDLGKKLKEFNPKINIIFVTGYNEFANEAFKILASGYITKPIGADDIKTQMDNLRYPVLENADDKTITAQCFGNFEIFRDGKPVSFGYSKSKEMIAYLIDRKGALCTNNEIMAVLWENEVKESYFQNVRRDLLQSLPEELFSRQKGKIGINPCEISCDYYSYIDNKYSGAISEYMTQYSWAETTLGELISK